MSSEIRLKLRSLLEDTTSRWGYRLAMMIQVLIATSVVVFTVQSVPGLTEETVALLGWTEVVLVSVFTIEYVLRLYAAEPRRSYALSWFGLIDLISIVPFYLGLTGVETFRVLRVFRMVRVLKLTRYSRSLQRLFKAFNMAKEELVLFVVVAVIVMYFSAVGIYMFENAAQPENFESVPHSFWWAIVTLTTVGYGDVYPVTVGGRIFTGFVLMTALGVVSMPSAIIASSLTEVRRIEDEAEEERLREDELLDGAAQSEIVNT